MILAVMLLPFTLGVVLSAVIAWPIAHRAGKRAHDRDQAEIARILGGYDAPPVVRAPIQWRPALTAPTAAHASLRVATTPKGYRPQHAALVRAHVAADRYIGRPRVAA